MKKVYVISFTMEANKMLEFTLSDIQFVFSSEKRANKQLNIIKKSVVDGKWWSDKNGEPLYGRILSDQYFVKNNGSYMRDVMVETPDGTKAIYRVTQVELNSGYNMNF